MVGFLTPGLLLILQTVAQRTITVLCDLIMTPLQKKKRKKSYIECFMYSCDKMIFRS